MQKITRRTWGCKLRIRALGYPYSDSNKGINPLKMFLLVFDWCAKYNLRCGLCHPQRTTYHNIMHTESFLPGGGEFLERILLYMYLDVQKVPLPYNSGS